MSSSDSAEAQRESSTDDSQRNDGPDPEALRTRLELLEEENQRLREEYARARQTRYRRTALSLAGLGAVAALGGLLFPAAQTVLFALAGTGAFLGLLTYYLAPEQFLPASLGETVYTALADNESSMVAELGLRETRVYVPTSQNVHLFVPQHEEYEVPGADDLEDVFVVTSDTGTRGVALEPTGDGLADEFERAVTGDPDDNPERVATQTTDALIEQFELVETATADVDPAGGRVTVAISGSTMGRPDRFDHPVVSFLACSLARRLNKPVTADVEPTPDGQNDYRVTLRWDENSENDEQTDAPESTA
ncbi:hypothetical protein [Haloarcula montana]|uniref:hypothetical protein n=1 Tax=Haloarcula montana TaxID=3111776 RepID=UPI002D79A4B8|nr:hypothetical protein [Haloarcula sp. GH36]